MDSWAEKAPAVTDWHAYYGDGTLTPEPGGRPRASMVYRRGCGGRKSVIADVLIYEAGSAICGLVLGLVLVLFRCGDPL